MIQVKNLTKKYDSVTALKNISFEIDEGEIVGFLGQNGAGKTTTMNIIAGYLAPTKGEVLINGKNILENPNTYKKSVGYLPEKLPLYEDMTVIEYLKFVCDLKKVPHVLKVHKLLDVESACKLSDVRNKLIKNLSKGYKQRVGFAQALMGDPKVLILDEPMNGLDPSQIIEMRALIKHLGQERTVLISSHNLSEVNAICDRIIIIDKGQILVEDTPSNLSKSVEGSNKILLKAKGDSDTILNILKDIPSVLKFETLALRENNEHDFLLVAESDMATEKMRKEVISKLTHENIDILELKVYELSLEEIFLKYTKNEMELEVKKELEKMDKQDKELFNLFKGGKNKKNKKDKKKGEKSEVAESAKVGEAEENKDDKEDNEDDNKDDRENAEVGVVSESTIKNIVSEITENEEVTEAKEAKEAKEATEESETLEAETSKMSESADETEVAETKETEKSEKAKETEKSGKSEKAKKTEKTKKAEKSKKSEASESSTESDYEKFDPEFDKIKAEYENNQKEKFKKEKIDKEFWGNNEEEDEE